MKQIMKFTLLALFLVTASITNAQQCGFINTALIMSEFPQVKNARTQLETHSKQLQKKLDSRLAQFQKKYQDALAKQEKGELSPMQLKTIEGDLEKEQNSILKEKQDIQQKILAKEQELLKPIIDKVQGAIDVIAKEKGYVYIFDSANSAMIVYAKKELDITSAVKSKLGI